MSIISVKACPSFLAIGFLKNPLLILETFRRIELIMFILSQREGKDPQPTIQKNSNKNKIFHKNINAALLNSYKDRVLGPQFQNFINASHCGYVEKMTKNPFGKRSWKRYFAVLSNVGLLYFSNPQGSPSGLYLLDCKYAVVDPEEVGGCTTAFRLTYSQTQVVFRCDNLSEFNRWKSCIKQLLLETEGNR